MLNEALGRIVVLVIAESLFHITCGVAIQEEREDVRHDAYQAHDYNTGDAAENGRDQDTPDGILKDLGDAAVLVMVTVAVMTRSVMVTAVVTVVVTR